MSDKAIRAALRKSQYDSGWALLSFDYYLADINGTILSTVASLTITPSSPSETPLTIGAGSHLTQITDDGKSIQVWVSGGAPGESGTILAQGTLSTGGTFGELFEYSIIRF